MTSDLVALTINTPNPDAARDFYAALGFEFKAVQVKHGGKLYRASNCGVELTILGVVDKQNAGTPTLQLAFRVTDIQETFSKLSQMPNINVMLEPTEFPDGTRAIVCDFDGNSVELSQR